MKLSIITVNRNDASGLRHTIQSIISQEHTAFEYVIIDGASTDESIDVINTFVTALGNRLKWISEPDKGIYDAMNKGISMASGDYVQFLNSGDCLAGSDVTARMIQALKSTGHPSILYGNMVKEMPDGKRKRDVGFAGEEITLLSLFIGTLNHSPAYIRKELFEKYGPYDDSLKIASDWKWYLKAIILGGEKPVYADIDVTLFDMTGISETNKELARQERMKVLEECIPATILDDYKRWTPAIRQMRRIERYPWAKKLVWFLERCLFKWEKRKA